MTGRIPRRRGGRSVTALRDTVPIAALALLLVTALAFADAESVGLSTVGAIYLPDPAIGATGVQADDAFGHAFATGDFDGDGREDLAVGVPGDSGPIGAPVPGSGSVIVFFGHATGLLAGSTPRLLSQTGSGFEPFDSHGYALAACDFDGDGFDDLAVGAPGESVGATSAAGAVFTYSGRPGGPVTSGAGLYTQDTIGIPDGAEVEDRFGGALACGDFDADGFADLAIGAPGEALNGAAKAGWAVAIPGSATGLAPAASQAFDQLGTGLPGEPDGFDQFAYALAAGDLDGDGFDDLAIGVPGEAIAAGIAHVVFGGPAGLVAAGSMLLTDGALGGDPDLADRFALALAFGDFDDDGFDDLVIGIPFDTFDAPTGVVDAAGQVVVVYGGPTIPTPGHVSHFAEDMILDPPASETGDRFGQALATGDFDGDGFDDLAIGHPGENPSAVPEHFDHGATTVIAGNAGGLGGGVRRFAPVAEGLPGQPPQTSRGGFGSALVAGDFDGDGFDDLASGLPLEVVSGIDAAGAAIVLPGAAFADGFESANADYWTPAP
ncbi:MAG: FG-GAP repeat protein [Thermoanaerobaculia bacterium]|nr:FG-GAP repeat protein [Thermoanaerobaculia bacterium]MBP9825153.1 FG-GAP repeat protein [Thermoanaerobaculia bacterium]